MRSMLVKGRDKLPAGVRHWQCHREREVPNLSAQRMCPNDGALAMMVFTALTFCREVDVSALVNYARSSAV